MALVTVLMRSLHTLAAAVWVGGSVIYLAVIIPALRVSPAAAPAAPVVAALFRRAVNACIGVLLVSGAYLTFDRLSSGAAGPLYVGLLVAKVAAASAMFLLAAFQAQEARRLRKQRGRLWTLAPRWILWLGVVAFVLGAAMAVVFEAGLSH
jgi:uncharacterized membrane protein